MLYFLFGRNEARIKERTEELISNDDKKSSDFGSQKAVWDASEDLDLNELVNFLRSPSLFGRKKIFILKNLFSKKIEAITSILQNQSIDSREEILGILTSFLSREECLKKDPTLWKFLNQKSNKIEELRPLKGQALVKWIENRLDSVDLKINSSALKKLFLYTGEDGHRINQELEKLICYGLSSNRNKIIIEEDDIEDLVAKIDVMSTFDIVDALGYGQKARALELFHHYISKGEDSNSLFGALIYQFRNLLVIREMINSQILFTDISRKLSLHPYVIKKSYDMAKKFELGELENIYNKLAEIDINFKGGKYNIEEGIFNFIVGV